jgi:hypothetical protein
VKQPRKVRRMGILRTPFRFPGRSSGQTGPSAAVTLPFFPLRYLKALIVCLEILLEILVDHFEQFWIDGRFWLVKLHIIVGPQIRTPGDLGVF